MICMLQLETCRIFVAVSTKLGFRICQMDVCRAFLNTEIQENVYLQVPEVVELEKDQTKFCKLNKAIYGLKRAPKY
jgi:Reverse transcriptase (RNA-dependent DNA polymerase).